MTRTPVTSTPPNPLVVDVGDLVAYMAPTGDTREARVTSIAYSETQERWIFTGYAPENKRITLWGYFDMILEVNWDE